MGTKRKHPKGKASICIYLPIPIAEAFDNLTTDPLTQKARYGAKSQIITSLIQNWIAEQQKKAPVT